MGCCDIKKLFFLIAAFAIRIAFVYIADLMDNADWCINYTDADYDVFSDAATHVRNGFGSPYARKTYRYTPLVAYMCILNNFYQNGLVRREPVWSCGRNFNGFGNLI